MTDFRYAENAQKLEEELLTELTEHSKERGALESEKQSATEDRRSGGLDRIAKGETPLDAVRSIIESQKKSPQIMREHGVSKKLAQMARRGRDTVEQFLENVKR